ncbi:hypothetical protein J121_1765 [Qipengyuania citrea LAMA 915]|uniref:Uncharacterized protein n=1 Tax=Qipengyuania citrea LAMA 915 TaxID=1306953 RepID=A0A0L1KHV6_9SPHN|nr:hypothetical protein J121_1765 [Qipengyuania citrea LAMA 915]
MIEVSSTSERALAERNSCKDTSADKRLCFMENSDEDCRS